jgi:hypothetical protein
MTDLIGESVLLDREEYDNLMLKADLGSSLLHYLLCNYQDDQWDSSTRDIMGECAMVFWGETITWNIDEEENEDD